MKQKSNKTANKRFKKTGNNKLLRTHAYSSHNKNKKSKARLRRQKEPKLIAKGFFKKITSILGTGT